MGGNSDVLQAISPDFDRSVACTIRAGAGMSALAIYACVHVGIQRSFAAEADAVVVPSWNKRLPGYSLQVSERRALGA